MDARALFNAAVENRTRKEFASLKTPNYLPTAKGLKGNLGKPLPSVARTSERREPVLGHLTLNAEWRYKNNIPTHVWCPPGPSPAERYRSVISMREESSNVFDDPRFFNDSKRPCFQLTIAHTIGVLFFDSLRSRHGARVRASVLPLKDKKRYSERYLIILNAFAVACLFVAVF